MSASRPHEMKSSTSQRAGSSRTFLKTMYLTSGAKVITRRLRTCTSPVRLYSLQSASASSAETRRRLVVEEAFMRDRAPRSGRDLTDTSCIGPGPDLLDHRFGVIAASLTEYAQASASATAAHSSCGTSCPSARPASASASSG